MPEKEYIKHLYENEDCSIREISARVGVNWRTAAKYARKNNWNTSPPDRRRPQPVMDPFVEIVDMWVMEDMLKPRKDRRSAAAIYSALVRDYGFPGKERTVRQYVSRRKKEFRIASQEKFLQLEHPPAAAQADFGTARVVWDGQLREIKVLTVSFPYSNAGFCVPVPSDNTECFLHALIQVFQWSGGVPQHIRFDNLSAAVVSVGKGEERELTEDFRRFMLHYRFQAEFCGAGKGNEKGSVENKVGYTRRNWLVPYPAVQSYEELTEELNRRALADMQRPHYQKGVSIAQLWAEEKPDLLPLPTVAFEPVRLETARVNKYCQIQCLGETYAVPSAAVGETVVLRLWWDRVEVFGQTQERLAVIPRGYILKTRAIDWKGYFGIYIRKPRGARHSTMYPFLPAPVRAYLEQGDQNSYRERLQFIHALLQEDLTMDLITEAIAQAGDETPDPARIRHQIYRLTHPEAPLEVLNEAYTPDSVRDYTPLITAYDRLVPRAGQEGGGMGVQAVVERAV